MTPFAEAITIIGSLWIGFAILFYWTMNKENPPSRELPTYEPPPTPPRQSQAMAEEMEAASTRRTHKFYITPKNNSQIHEH